VFANRWVEAEQLFKEFKVSTFGNKKILEGLISQVNSTETLKYIDPDNVVIENRITSEKTSFPGAWFVSNERVCVYQPFGTEPYRDDFPVETLESVSAKGNGLTAGKVFLATDSDIITFSVSYKEETYRKIERVLDDLIQKALELRQDIEPVELSIV